MTLIGLDNNPICVYGRIKSDYLVCKKGKLKLINGSNYPSYRMGYWLIEPIQDEWVVWKVLFV